jgi:arylsulfatase
MGGHWDDPLLSLGRPMVTNLLMDPFERQWGNENRKYAVIKGWVLTPMLGLAMEHLASFKEFAVRQVGLSADVGKTLEGVQSQILKLQQAR